MTKLCEVAADLRSVLDLLDQAHPVTTQGRYLCHDGWVKNDVKAFGPVHPRA